MSPRLFYSFYSSPSTYEQRRDRLRGTQRETPSDDGQMDLMHTTQYNIPDGFLVFQPTTTFATDKLCCGMMVFSLLCGIFQFDCVVFRILRPSIKSCRISCKPSSLSYSLHLSPVVRSHLPNLVSKMRTNPVLWAFPVDLSVRPSGQS